MEVYAVSIRYPDVGFDPSREEAIEALALAEVIVVKVRAELPMS
jgi:hypothetical protein